MQRDLVERAQRGDRRSFGDLATASTSRLYNLAQLMLRDSDLAQDAVQEALIQAWRDLRALRDPDRFDPWLHRILVRCVYRVAKRERQQVERRQLIQADAWSAPDPSVQLADRDQIDQCFRRLKVDYRAVLVLHHYLEFRDDEAAEILRVPTGTYKSRLHRATAALRAEIEADARTDAHFRAGVSR